MRQQGDGAAADGRPSRDGLLNGLRRVGQGEDAIATTRARGACYATGGLYEGS
jgi:hypothetical protein